MANAAPKIDGQPWDNPMGTDGFEFVEFASPNGTSGGPDFDALFVALGFTRVARHRRKDVALYRQGDISFLVNAEPGSQAQRFAGVHGPGASAMAFRVADSKAAAKLAIDLGAIPVGSQAGTPTLDIPAIEGIGGSLVYLADRYGNASIYDQDFAFEPGVDARPTGAGLAVLDHLTHNVMRGRMDHWYDYYSKLFNFREIRYFDIEGQHTGLKSRALTGACGKLRIPINEPSGDAGKKDQISEYLDQYKGEGIQHIALATDDILATYDRLKVGGVKFMTPPPDTYYEMLDERLPGHGRNVAELQKRGILLDGAGPGKLLLQIFTETAIGPIFFEIISRKGDEGFGEGNFRALFESMERDQIRRGVLKVSK